MMEAGELCLSLHLHLHLQAPNPQHLFLHPYLRTELSKPGKW